MLFKKNPKSIRIPGSKMEALHHTVDGKNPAPVE
jgi:hypothetical protein